MEGSPARDPSPSPEDDGAEQGQAGGMPLTMAQSLVLSSLPKDASAALKGAGDLAQSKVKVRLQPVGSAPPLPQKVFNITSTQKFEFVINFLRKRLRLSPGEGVFCYVNNVFAPSPDEVVGNLWKCFKSGDELVVGYAKTPAFG